jgi:hypothetical protein
LSVALHSFRSLSSAISVVTHGGFTEPGKPDTEDGDARLRLHRRDRDSMILR